MGHTVRSAAALVAGALLLGSATSTSAALDGPPPVDPPPVEITVPPGPAPEPSPTMRTGEEALFNYPVPGTPDLSISDALVGLVDGTPAGESIVLSYFVIQPGHPVIDALLRAYSRGVSVKAVLDSGDGQKAKKNGAVDAAYAKLAETLGTAGDSFARQCNRSCITDEPDSINHNKFAAFSRTGDAVNVVFQGTGNLRVDGSGDSAYNAGVIIRGDQTTYQQYLGYFDDLYTERRVDKDNYHLAPAPRFRTGDRVLLPPHGQDRHSVRGVAQRQLHQPADHRAGDGPVLLPQADTQHLARHGVRRVCRSGSRPAGHLDTRLLRQTRHPQGRREDRAQPDQGPGDDPCKVRAGRWLVRRWGRPADHLDGQPQLHRQRPAAQRRDVRAVRGRHGVGRLLPELRPAVERPLDELGMRRAGAEDNAAVEKSGDTEVTKIARRSQTAKRALPKAMRERQVVRPVRTAQGRKITTRAYCKRAGSSSKMRKQDRCRVVKGKVLPRVVIRSDKPLRVRIVQTAKASKRLLPFKRSAAYRYMPKKSRAVRL